MDLASLLGLIGCVSMILFAMIMGGYPMAYVDPTSILIVLGGTLFFSIQNNFFDRAKSSFGSSK